MTGRSWIKSVVLCVLLSSAYPAQADIDVAEYQTSRSVQSEDERRALQQNFETERRREAEREAALRAAAERELADAQARQAARPWPERLTQARCTHCHADQNYLRIRHALPGWWLVILRMRYFNRAELTWPEMWIISQHLTTTHPADSWIVLLEWLVPLLPFSTLIVLVKWRRRCFLNSTKESRHEHAR